MPPKLPNPKDQDFLQQCAELRDYRNVLREKLQKLSKSLALGHEDPVRLLDHRAATYHALGRFEEGLKDAKKMLKMDKSNPRGYLRTAQFLVSMGKLEDALKVYSRSLSTSEAGSRERKEAEAWVAKLKLILNPPKRVDPMVILPPELVSMILEYLDLRSTIRFIQVSRHWHSLGNSLSKQWSSLDLSIAQKDVSFTAIRAFIAKTNGVIKTAKLTRVSPNVWPKVIELLSRCVSLKSLQIMQRSTVTPVFPILGLPNLESLEISRPNVMFLDNLFDVIANSPRLKNVAAHCERPRQSYKTPPAVPQLESLKLSSSRPDKWRPFESRLFRNGDLETIAPNLRTLELQGPSSPQDANLLPAWGHGRLTSFSYSHLDWENFHTLPATLKTLVLSDSRVYEKLSTDLDNLTCLETGWFELFRGLTPRLLRTLVSQNKATLRRLSLRWCSDIFREHIEPLMTEGLLESVTVLSICGVFGVDDTLIPVIINTMPKLKALDIRETRVTGMSLKWLADAQSPKLERIFVSELSLDAVEYARSRQIHVERHSRHGGRNLDYLATY